MDPKIHPVTSLQDAAWRKLASLPSLLPAKLCGGTALSRFYLNHRVSFDLDFFLPPPFDPVRFAAELRLAGIRAEVLAMAVDIRRANQWHGMIKIDGNLLKVSLVEDSYFDLYPEIINSMGGLPVRTETIDGLYHRKLLTITHASEDGVTPTGGRQTARDLFDLWVLSKTVKPLTEFIATVPYDYPMAAFKEGLWDMPWFELTGDLSEIMAAPGFDEGRSIEVVRPHLFKQVGEDVSIEEQQDDEDAEEARQQRLKP
jgi:hypothetical protein